MIGETITPEQLNLHRELIYRINRAHKIRSEEVPVLRTEAEELGTRLAEINLGIRKETDVIRRSRLEKQKANLVAKERSCLRRRDALDQEMRNMCRRRRFINIS